MIKKLRLIYLLPFFLCACDSDNATSQDAHLMAGKRAFDKCTACHEITKPVNKVGPHLVGIWNRPAAKADKFPYSLAMQASDVVWTAENLSQYIENPREFIPYNRMSFIGIKDPEERQALLDYLRDIAGDHKAP